MKKKKIITICGILFVVLVVAVCITAVQISKQNLEDAKNDLQQSYEKYGWVEKETVDVLVGKFNAQVVDNSSLNPASQEYLQVSDDIYGYGLITGISLFIRPEEFKNNPSVEIVDHMIIYVDRSSEYAGDALEYVKYLIKANNGEITDKEADTLISEAKEKAATETSANNGKGISVGYVEDEETYQYHVMRLYK